MYRNILFNVLILNLNFTQFLFFFHLQTKKIENYVKFVILTSILINYISDTFESFDLYFQAHFKATFRTVPDTICCH